MNRIRNVLKARVAFAARDGKGGWKVAKRKAGARESARMIMDKKAGSGMLSPEPADLLPRTSQAAWPCTFDPVR